MKNRATRWLLPFAVIGASATVRAAFSLFATTGRRPRDMWTNGTAPVESVDFLEPLAAILGVPLATGGRVELLNNGEEWLDRMLADFQAARHNITFSVYMWKPGKLSDLIFDALIERARAGVQVRILLDALGGKDCPDEDIERLEAAGGSVCVFRPLKIGKLDLFHLRNHRRAIVIDGEIGYTGGMAVADHWLGNARDKHEWRDIMVRVTGPMALQVQSAFAEMWAYVCGEVLTGREYFPDAPDDGSGIRSLALVSSPSSEEHPLQLLFYESFMAARERLWITTPYFVPDKNTLHCLAQRARDGIDVRLLLPSKYTDANAVRRAGQWTYQELLDAGVRIYEYQPTMIHTKSMVVDGMWSVVGSANLDIRSKELNEENVLGILDRELGRTLEQVYEKDLERAREVTAEEWRRRSLATRALERVSWVFSEQY
jgi:cardiolipin synthase